MPLQQDYRTPYIYNRAAVGKRLINIIFPTKLKAFYIFVFLSVLKFPNVYRKKKQFSSFQYKKEKFYTKS